eukprot:6942363-Pyramimonas_sp.AAC.1
MTAAMREELELMMAMRVVATASRHWLSHRRRPSLCRLTPTTNVRRRSASRWPAAAARLRRCRPDPRARRPRAPRARAPRPSRTGTPSRPSNWTRPTR